MKIFPTVNVELEKVKNHHGS